LDHFQDFSAIQTGGPLPGMTEDRYVYRSGNLMRMQGDADLPEYFVTDLAKQQTHSVSSRGCLESASAYKLSFPFFVTGPAITYERIPIGQETVDGHKCHVEDLIIHNPKNPVVVHFRLSEADDLQGFPIKIENRRDHAYPWVIRYKRREGRTSGSHSFHISRQVPDDGGDEKDGLDSEGEDRRIPENEVVWPGPKHL
jgi:hypothetical protein